MVYLSEIIYYAIPAAAVLFFFISLFRYLSGRHRNRRQPGSVSEQSMRTRRILLIISSVIAGILVAFVAALIALMMLAVAYM